MTNFIHGHGSGATRSQRIGNVHIASVRNVNEAFNHLMGLAQIPQLWRTISPRGMETLEYRGVFVTEYACPKERVLFNPVRDANPFFHFMEALWIMDGRDDVAFLNQFNSNISTFSDDGKTFNAPYGYRLRRHFKTAIFGTEINYSFHPEERAIVGMETVDQVVEIVELLRRDPDTRRAVLCLWDPVKDLNRESKDIPCNDLVAFKLRDGVLDMTVMNRSNDAMWGAYGANAVQFSMLQEFVACAVGVEVGCYRQVSDSFHVYTSQNTWLKCSASYAEDVGHGDPYADQFGRSRFNLVPLMPTDESAPRWGEWLAQNHYFLNDRLGTYGGRIMPFFHSVAVPMMTAWRLYKNDDEVVDKNTKIDAAQAHLQERCEAEDWSTACIRWLERRRQK